MIETRIWFRPNGHKRLPHSIPTIGDLWYRVVGQNTVQCTHLDNHTRWMGSGEYDLPGLLASELVVVERAGVKPDDDYAMDIGL